MNSLNRLFKHTFVYGLATVLPRMLTVLLTWLLTNYLPSRADFGQISIIFTWIMIFNVILTYGTETSFFRYFSKERDPSKVLGTAIVSLLASTLLFTVIAYINIDYIASWSNKSPNYWRWVIGVLALDTLTVIPFAYMRAQGKAINYAIIKMINVVIMVGCSVVFLVWLSSMPVLNELLPDDKIELYFIASLITSLLTLIMVGRVYIKPWSFDFILWKKMLRYGYPILIAGLAFVTIEAIDKVLLEYLLSDDALTQVGIYSGCYKLAVGMTLFATAFKLGIEPFFFSEAGNIDAPKLYAQITKLFVILGSMALMLYIVFVDLIKHVIIESSYEEGMDIVPLILIAYLFFGVYQSISVWYKVTNKTRYGAYISIMGALITIVLNLWLIPIIGYMASAITTCVAYGLMMVVSYLWSRKHFVIPYDVKSIIVLLILSITFSTVFFYLFRAMLGAGHWLLYLIGISMTILLAAIIWKLERHFIKQLIKYNGSKNH